MIKIVHNAKMLKMVVLKCLTITFISLGFRVPVRLSVDQWSNISNLDGWDSIAV